MAARIESTHGGVYLLSALERDRMFQAGQHETLERIAEDARL